MVLSQSDFQILLDLASKAAVEAGKYIFKRSSEEIEVHRKIGGESLASQVVTEVDEKAQEIILEILNPSLKKYDLALLTEESEDDKSRFEKEYFWCIDPLDGTLPFTEGKDGYAVSIALVSESGVSKIGVVFNPVCGDLYTAIQGQGAFKNGEKIVLKNGESLTFLHDRSFLSEPNYNEVLRDLENKAKGLNLANLSVIFHCGSVMNAMNVIDFSPAIYFKFPKIKPGGGSIWDFAASSCICSEAGVFVSDYNGNSLDLNRIDSTFMNHRGVRYSSVK